MSSLSRLLLLEDSGDDALLIIELLREAYGGEITIDHAVTAEDATRLVDRQRYDLFLIDYMLGEPPNGREWLTMVGQSITLPPVIMLTGLPDAERIEAIASRGAEISYFVTKDTIRSGALTQAIGFALSNQHSAHAVTANTILLADDDGDDVMLIEDALQELAHPYNLDVVESGEMVMEYLCRRGKYSSLQEHPLPGLILLDLNMPRMDGRQVLQAMRRERQLSAIPVVVLSTSSAPQDVYDCYDLGANSFICKPASFEDLVCMMRNLTSYWFELVSSAKS
ncbi:MAG: response regulator [Mariprofundales bacterium]|nr:response regulator [Mariprofundales bacterium]